MIRRRFSSLLHRTAPSSLRRQLLSISLLILSGLLLLIGVLQYFLIRDFTYTNRAETMETQLRSVPREFFFNLYNYSLIEGNTDNSDGAGGSGISSWFKAGSTGGSIGNGSMMPGGLRNGPDRRPLLLDAHATLAIYSSDGIFKDFQQETLSTAPAPQLTNEEYQALMKRTPDRVTGKYKLITAEDGSEQLAVFMNLGKPGNTRMLLQMTVDTGPLKEVILKQLLIFAGLSVTALLAGLLLYLPALRKTLIPLSNMGESAQRIDAGNLDVRFPEAQGQLEVDKLSASFNGMLERLEVSFRNEREAKEQMRRFAADASHELRTPLTSIHGFLEVLLRGAADNKEQLYSALHSMHGESKRINKLVEDLLLLARMDGAPQLRVADLELGGILDEMTPGLAVLAGNREVSFDISYGIHGMYDADKIKQVILNLFHNAVQHTDDAEGVIQITLHAKGNRAELTMRDNGSGIAAEHVPRVFDRFYRSDSSRTRKYGGSGLGLSISRSIVEAHGGDISVRSIPGESTVFKVTLPCLEGIAGGR
jgi:two-component system OmpR family sensor kinase